MNKLFPFNFCPQVSYLRTKEIEAEALVVFQSYTKMIGEIKIPIDTDLIIEKILKMELSIENLSETLPESLIDVGDEILGVSYIDSRLVVIDSNLEEKPGRFAFTAAHEIGHLILHQSFIKTNFDQLSLLFKDEQPPSVVCRSNASKNRMEWQADYFAGALLMPKDIFLNHFLKELKGIGLESYDELINLNCEIRERILSKIILNLSQTFGVSKEAARVRLEVLGIKFNELGSLFRKI